MCKFEYVEQSWNRYSLNLNKIKFNDVRVRQKNERFYVKIASLKESNSLFAYRWEDFRELYSLSGKSLITILNSRLNTSITIRKLENKRFEVRFKFSPDFVSWNHNFNFSQYLDTVEKQIKKRFITKKRIYLDSISKTGFTICVANILFSDTIKTGLNKLIKTIKELDEESLRELAENNNYLTYNFDFPDELKIPCEQYLLYFAQFLQDLGINATSNLKEEAGKVLFSVTPTDDVEALDKIREALALYLNLPSSPIVYDDSFASVRLQAEIERLQSSQRIAEMEFRVAQKALVSQDKIIHQQSVLLEQQAKVIEKINNPKVMIDSAENKEELEKIYDGIEVGESKFLNEKLGIKLNPAKAIKTAVRNTFGKGDEIIELGLDKKE